MDAHLIYIMVLASAAHIIIYIMKENGELHKQFSEYKVHEFLQTV